MSNNSAVPIAAPKTLRYEQDAGLPVAIEARSNRRTFYPSNGEVFAPDGTNVIRMTLNSNSFVDFAHSYLQFKVTNKTLADGDGNALHVAPDFGLPFFNRLQIMSGRSRGHRAGGHPGVVKALRAATGYSRVCIER